MEKFKINADSVTFYALLHAFCKNKNVEEAEELLLLNRKFFPLETEGFKVVLNGWCNIIIDVVEAKRVWREMSNCRITPDGTSYSHMICCFAKVGNLFDALRLYDQMKKRCWVPDLVDYNLLIYALTRENCLNKQKRFVIKF
nr:pentatricopeptide repeat protein AaPPR793 [Agave angustifolia]